MIPLADHDIFLGMPWLVHSSLGCPGWSITIPTSSGLDPGSSSLQTFVNATAWYTPPIPDTPQLPILHPPALTPANVHRHDKPQQPVELTDYQAWIDEACKALQKAKLNLKWLLAVSEIQALPTGDQSQPLCWPTPCHKLHSPWRNELPPRSHGWTITSGRSTWIPYIPHPCPTRTTSVGRFLQSSQITTTSSPRSWRNGCLNTLPTTMLSPSRTRLRSRLGPHERGLESKLINDLSSAASSVPPCPPPCLPFPLWET